MAIGLPTHADSTRYAYASDAGATSITFAANSIPSTNIAEGDHFVVFIFKDDNAGGAQTAPSGWTKWYEFIDAGGDDATSVGYYHTVTATEASGGSAAVTFTMGESEEIVARMIHVTGADDTDFDDNVTPATYDHQDTNSPDPAQVTTNTNGAVVITITGNRTHARHLGAAVTTLVWNTSPPSGYTIESQALADYDEEESQLNVAAGAPGRHQQGTGNGDAQMTWAHYTKATAGTENPGAFAGFQNLRDHKVVTVAIKPSSTSPSTSGTINGGGGISATVNRVTPSITSVTPSTFAHATTGIDIVGSNFNATQGSGAVTISQGGGAITREDTTTTVIDTATTTHTYNYPTTVNADDLLICIAVSAKGNSTFSSSAFTEIFDDTNTGNDVSMFIGTRTAVGNEDGSTFTVSTNQSDKSVAVVYRLSGAGAVTVSTAATGTSTTPDPPSHTDSNAAFWIAVAGTTWGAIASSGPSSWSNFGTATNAGENDASVNFADLTSSTSPQNPGTFTIGWSEVWIAATIGVAAGGAEQTQTITSWADTAIEFTAVANLLADGAATLTVRNSHALTDTYAVTIADTNQQTSGTLNGGGGLSATVTSDHSTSSTINGGGGISTSVTGDHVSSAQLNNGGSITASVTATEGDVSTLLVHFAAMIGDL